MARLRFLGGAQSVTGAHYLIETSRSRVAIDCGLTQGGRHCPLENYEPFGYNVASLNAVLITHAHIDHTGRLPKLVREGFSGPIFATAPTCELAPIMLEDSQSLIEDECGDSRGVLYSMEDVEAATKQYRPVSYGEMLDITPDIRARFRDAGHILGSASIEVWVREGEKETKFVFSGDLGNPPTPLLAPTDYVEDADYALIETAYGNRLHEDRDDRRAILEATIEQAINARGVLMVPAFAIERTQELLFEINHLVENKLIPPVEVFLDSPMAIKATRVYAASKEFFNAATTDLIHNGDDVFDFPRLTFTMSTEESKRINEVPPPKVIIAGSGMSNGGRILHHELRYLPGENNTILFMGYQAEGTLGRTILEGAEEVTIFGEKIPVRAGVRAIGGYSAHADQEGLLKWLSSVQEGGRLKRVFCVQGEAEAASEFARIAQQRLGVEAEVPSSGEVFEF